MRNLRFFVIVSLAALGLRLFFVLRFPGVVTDSFIYGDIASNWLQHGIYGLSGTEGISPTYIRLPGYPAFLALIFAIFGKDHYRAVLIVQLLVDLGTCFLCADIAWRLFGRRAAKMAFVLAALCPFLANYSAAALTETLEIFFTALALSFNRWTKSWIADYVSVEEIYWAVPGSKIDPATLPGRAFDSLQQKQQTMQLIVDYNDLLHISPSLDTRFEAISEQRVHAHPARYYLGLPTLRILDMWLRPRTEILPCDSRWWEFNDEPRWSALAVGMGVVNLAYVLCAIAGWMKFRNAAMIGMLVLFVLLRSVFLGTLENPEPRYTLEMYPVIIVVAAAALIRREKSA